MLILNKFASTFLSLSSFALLGQFQNLMNIGSVFSSGGVADGVVRFTAHYSNNKMMQQQFWKSALTICSLASIITFLLLILFSKWINSILPDSISLPILIVIASIGFCAGGLNILILATFNGLQLINKWTLGQIGMTFIQLFWWCMMISMYQLTGAIIAVLTQPVLNLIWLLLLVNKIPEISFDLFSSKLKKGNILLLLQFSVMILVSAILSPLVYMIIRYLIANQLSWTDAGIWQGTWKLSGFFQQILTNIFAIYYLPNLVKISDNNDLRKFVIKILIRIFVISSISLGGMYLFRYELINFMFSAQFQPIIHLLPIQFIGDLARTVGWCFGYILIARKMIVHFIWSELISHIIFLSGVFLLLPSFGLMAAPIAYLCESIFYIILIITILNKTLWAKNH